MRPPEGLSSAIRLYCELTDGIETAQLPEMENWSDLIDRISVPGRVNEITEDTYRYFLEVLPPKLFGGDHFCFAEGDEPLRLFWYSLGRYFCRQLTREETDRLCEATGLPREYGYA